MAKLVSRTVLLIAAPRLAMPCHALTCPALPCHAAPRLAMPRFAKPCTAMFVTELYPADETQFQRPAWQLYGRWPWPSHAAPSQSHCP